MVIIITESFQLVYQLLMARHESCAVDSHNAHTVQASLPPGLLMDASWHLLDCFRCNCGCHTWRLYVLGKQAQQEPDTVVRSTARIDLFWSDSNVGEPFQSIWWDISETIESFRQKATASERIKSWLIRTIRISHTNNNRCLWIRRIEAPIRNMCWPKSKLTKTSRPVFQQKRPEIVTPRLRQAWATKTRTWQSNPNLHQGFRRGLSSRKIGLARSGLIRSQRHKIVKGNGETPNMLRGFMF